MHVCWALSLLTIISGQHNQFFLQCFEINVCTKTCIGANPQLCKNESHALQPEFWPPLLVFTSELLLFVRQMTCGAGGSRSSSGASASSGLLCIRWDTLGLLLTVHETTGSAGDLASFLPHESPQLDNVEGTVAQVCLICCSWMFRAEPKSWCRQGAVRTPVQF